MSEEIIDIYNFSELRQRGIDALTKALGPVGMAYFLRQFEPGHGDYTAERGALLADVKLEDFEAYAKRGKELVNK
jgi:hypothetical protein